jgi:hypothetical protein
MSKDNWNKHGDGSASLTNRQIFNHPNFDGLMKDVQNLREIVRGSDYCNYLKQSTSESRCRLCSVSLRERCEHLLIRKDSK